MDVWGNNLWALCLSMWPQHGVADLGERRGGLALMSKRERLIPEPDGGRAYVSRGGERPKKCQNQTDGSLDEWKQLFQRGNSKTLDNQKLTLKVRYRYSVCFSEIHDKIKGIARKKTAYLNELPKLYDESELLHSVSNHHIRCNDTNLTGNAPCIFSNLTAARWNKHAGFCLRERTLPRC